MKRLCLVVFAVVFILFAIGDFLLFKGEAESWWENIPGFFALFGLTFCVVIVLASKFLGHFWLQRKEDYYNSNHRNEGDD